MNSSAQRNSNNKLAPGPMNNQDNNANMFMPGQMGWESPAKVSPKVANSNTPTVVPPPVWMKMPVQFNQSGQMTGPQMAYVLNLSQSIQNQGMQNGNGGYPAAFEFISSPVTEDAPALAGWLVFAGSMSHFACWT